MSHSKKFLFSQREQLTADFCKAVCHPARLRILSQLRNGRVLTATDLGKDIPLAATTIQNHLLILQRGQLIELAADDDCMAGFRLVKDLYWDLLDLVWVEVGGKT